jgi:hypothetical protein
LFIGFGLGRHFENILNVLCVDCSVGADAVLWLSNSPHAVPKGHLCIYNSVCHALLLSTFKFEVMVKYCVVLCLQTLIYTKESEDSWTTYMTNDQSKMALQQIEVALAHETEITDSLMYIRSIEHCL